jgi:TonB-dependent receptor
LPNLALFSLFARKAQTDGTNDDVVTLDEFKLTSSRPGTTVTSPSSPPRAPASRRKLSLPVPFRAFHGLASRLRLFQLALLCLLFLSPAFGQSAGEANIGTIEGTVYNVASGLPLGRAKISIKGTWQETLTDDEGRFQFSGISAGETQLEVSYLGFNPQTATVTVTPGTAVSHDFQLAREGSAKSGADGDVVLLEKFTVVADQAMTAQALAMNEQRHAANIKNVVAFEELGDYGQENIGDYVRFLPGVAIVDDGENPGTLALGGFPVAMSNVQLDGGEVASTGMGTSSSRTLTLQDVPMTNIERIEVSKVPTPDMAASGLGGSMNLVTKSLLGIKRPVFTYQMYMNFNNKDGFSFDGGGRQPVSQLSPKSMQPSFNASLEFPVGRRLAFSLGVSRSWRQRPTDNTPTEYALWNLRGADPSTGAAKDITLATAQWMQMAQITSIENIQAGVEWKIARNDSLAFSIQHRETSTEQAGSRLNTLFHNGANYNPVGDATHTESVAGTNGAGTGQIAMGGGALLNSETAAENTHMSLRYQHKGPKWRLDGQAVYSKGVRERNSVGKGYFAATNAVRRTVNTRGDGIGVGDTILPAVYTVTGTSGNSIDPYDGKSYDLESAMEEYGRYKTDVYFGQLNVERIIGRHFSIKTGGAYNRLEKDDNRPAKTYQFAGDGISKSAANYDVIDDTIAVRANGSPVSWISPVKFYNLFLDHPEYFTPSYNNVVTEAQNSKRMIEEISAAYLRLDLRTFHNRLHVIGGARYEKTKLDGWSMVKDEFAVYKRNPDGSFETNPSTGAYIKKTNDTTEQNNLIYQKRALHDGQDYDGFYPSVNINYSFSDNLVARAAYARTIGRPDVQYVVAGLSLPDPTSTDPEIARAITVGNPGLEPWTADSFHLSLDSYHLKEGFGSIGVYRKNVANFFAQRSIPATEETLRYYGISENDMDYMLENNYFLRRWENIGNAHLIGFEMSYRQTLFFLPSWLQNMQVWVNYTHLKVGGANAEDFTGFTPDAVSWGVNYIRPRFSIRLTCAYQAETKKTAVIYTPGTSSERYIPDGTYDYQASHTRYGISAEYAMTQAFTLYMNWSDVFAKDLIVYRRAPGTPDYAQTYQRYTAPSYIMVGVKGRF